MNHSFVGHSGNQSFGRLWPKNTLICFELWIIYVTDGKRLVIHTPKFQRTMSLFKGFKSFWIG